MILHSKKPPCSNPPIALRMAQPLSETVISLDLYLVRTNKAFGIYRKDELNYVDAFLSSPSVNPKSR